MTRAVAVSRCRAASAAMLAGAVLVSLAAACSSAEPKAAAPTSTAAAAGATVATPTGTTVHAITIAVDEPADGHLTFDALAAGDPAAARHGKLILLLHGFPEADESYREVLPVLARAGYYAVAPNQRGYSPGARPAKVSDYGILHLVGDVTAMATALGADRFHLVGHDWGGGVAWATAGLAPTRVVSLTALSTPDPDAMTAAFHRPGDPQIAASGYMATFRKAGSERLFLGDGTQPPATSFTTLMSAVGLPAAKAAAYAKVLATPAAMHAALNWYRANDLENGARIGRITVPTLYLFGAKDHYFARSTADATRAYVHAPYTFQLVPSGTHWLPEEIPGRIAADVLTLIRSTEH